MPVHEPLVKVPLLDHGYIALVESWGCDEKIIEAARMSTDKGFLGWELKCEKCEGCGWVNQILGDTRCAHCRGTGKRGDEFLLEHLYTHKHSTPFEFAGFSVEVQLPIMAIREWHRHRTQSYAEMSARYTPLPDFNYMPTVDRLLMKSTTNKQAGTLKGSDELSHATAIQWLSELEAAYKHCEEVYQLGLNLGVPKELARMIVPVGRYTRMRAQAVLRNWLAFLTLRCDTAAQWEIRQFALEVAKIVKQLYPRTYALYVGDAKAA